MHRCSLSAAGILVLWVLTSPARAILNLTGGDAYLVSHTFSPANCVSAQSEQWTAAVWFLPRDESPLMRTYIWTESNPETDAYAGIALRDSHVWFTLRGLGGVMEYDVGELTVGYWHLVIVERQGESLRAYLDNGPAEAFTHDTAVPLAVTTTTVGALLADDDVFGGLDAEIACVATWLDYATSAQDRAAIWNGGTPSIAAISAVDSPYYFFELLDGRASTGPIDYLGQVGAPQWKSNHAIAGGSLLEDRALILNLPNCVAFWAFQDGPGVDPVDAKNGYVLQRTGDVLPDVVSGGVFGEKALYFHDGGLFASKVGNPPAIPATSALDISGPSAQFSIVTWFRDYAFPYAPLDYAKSKFVAGLWDETDPGHRQYAMFLSVGDDAEDRVISYFCSLSNAGGASFNDGFPDDIYNHEWAGSGQAPLVNDSVMHLAVATYDGLSARAYLDGEFEPYTYGDHGVRNPYASGDGGGVAGGPALNGDFSVGIHKVVGNWTTQFTGVIAGVAVFDRALSDQEIADIAAGIVHVCIAGSCDDDDPCTTDVCSNGVDSNGVSAAICTYVPVACSGGRICEPDSGNCVECLVDADCTDFVFCDGAEICMGGACQSGIPPCDVVGFYCDEFAEQCAACAPDFDCDGDVDLVDYAHLADCLGGPDAAPPGGCNDADLNGGGTVDLADVAAFYDAFAP